MKGKIASTGMTLTLSDSIPTSRGTIIGPVPAPRPPGRALSTSNVEGAVYAYIQAVRALGKTRISTAEIAKALGLPETAVRNAAASLTDKGVRAAE